MMIRASSNERLPRRNQILTHSSYLADCTVPPVSTKRRTNQHNRIVQIQIDCTLQLSFSSSKSQSAEEIEAFHFLPLTMIELSLQFHLFLLILGLSSFTTESLKFELLSGHTKCISEDIKSNSMTVGKYSVVNPSEGQPIPDSHKITVRVRMI